LPSARRDGSPHCPIAVQGFHVRPHVVQPCEAVLQGRASSAFAFAADRYQLVGRDGRELMRTQTVAEQRTHSPLALYLRQPETNVTERMTNFTLLEAMSHFRCRLWQIDLSQFSMHCSGRHQQEVHGITIFRAALYWPVIRVSDFLRRHI
jgi:hypothetical protein